MGLKIGLTSNFFMICPLWIFNVGNMLGGVDVQQVVGLVEGQPFVPKATSRVVGFFPHEHINWPY